MTRIIIIGTARTISTQLARLQEQTRGLVPSGPKIIEREG